MPLPFLESNLKRYWTITELARELSIPTSVINYWEKESVLKYLLRSRPGTPRRYSKFYADRIRKIHHLAHVKGITLKGVLVELTGINTFSALSKTRGHHKSFSLGEGAQRADEARKEAPL